MCDDLDYNCDFDTGEVIDYSSDSEPSSESFENIEVLDFDDNSDSVEVLEIQEDDSIEMPDFDNSEIEEFSNEEQELEPVEMLDIEEDVETLEINSDIGTEGDNTVDIPEIIDEDIYEEISEDTSTDESGLIQDIPEDISDNVTDETNYIDSNDVQDLYIDEPYEVPEDTYIDEDNETAQFTDWENAYKDEIDEIENDPSLTNEEKIALLQSSFNDFNQNNELNYLDSDIDEDNGPAKVLKINRDSPNTLNTYDDTLEALPISDVNQWIGDINPNYDEFDYDSPYSNNCGSCAYAVYQRLEGNPDVCATAENIGYNDQMEALTGMEQVSMAPDEIEQRLLEQGEGAHAIIGIDRAEGAGHWFNAACIDGKVVAIDGQTGEINDWPPDYGDVVNWEMSVRKETNNE